MCGIVGYVGMRSAQQVLLDGLEKLEYRGYDSAGVALTQRDGIRVVKSKGRLSTLRSKLEELALPQSSCGIGHTRWATHGEPSDVNSHPHSTPRVSIVHNGIIENYGALKERLIAKGYTFASETDTEVLVKLIDSCYQGEPLQALQAALAKVRGSYALAVLFKDYPDTIFAVKRESPLIVGWGEGENFVASDIPALLKYTRSYSVLEEGDMAVCTAQGIRFYNEFGEAVEREKLTADWDMEAAEKGGYPHFMLKEINEQPAAITATVSPRVENGMPDLRIPELSDEKLRSIKNIHLVACGTAMHAGMVGKTAIERLARVPAEVDIASEFRYRDPILDPDDLVIIISQSGETADSLAALELERAEALRREREQADSLARIEEARRKREADSLAMLPERIYVETPWYIKSNLLYDAVLMPSLEVEYRFSEHWSAAVEGNMAWWHNNGKHKYYQLATIIPEARYWFKPQGKRRGHYLGLFGGGGWYDLENGGRGYKGEGGMVGLSYGYMFPIGKYFALEAGLGVGFMTAKYEEYLPIDGHYVYQQTERTNYFGPLKLKFAFVWNIGRWIQKGGNK